MTGPLDTERAFRDLHHNLQYPSSPIHRLRRICSFLVSVQDSRTLHESYILELLTLVPGFLKVARFTGIDPEDLVRLHDCLQESARGVPSVSTMPAFLDALSSLRRQAAGLYQLLGERERAAQLIGSGEPDIVTSSPQPFSVMVPVVERHQDPGPAEQWGGSLRRIILTPLGAAKTGRDEIHIDVAVFGAEADATNILVNPLAAMRSLVHARNPQLRDSFLRAQIRFEEEHALHQGSSANLAMAALLYCALLDVALQRDLYRVTASVVITGAVDGTGTILPIDDASILPKTAAVFFSPAETLVVPKAQAALFEERLAELNRKYPRRAVTVLAASHLRELFFDRRITSHARMSLPHHAIRQVWKRRRWVAAAVMLLLSLAVAKLMYGPLDRIPASYHLKGESLEIVNQQDQLLERIPVGRRTVEGMEDSRLQTRAPVALADVDRDGEKEILWIQISSEYGRLLASIKCKGLGEDALRWSHRLELDLDFPNNADVTSPDFMATHILVDDFDADGKVEVVVNYRHEMFPGVVQMLAAATGEAISHYLHIGHFADMRERDLDRDGVKEILLTGTNNAFREACLVVLDPRKLSGHSPLTPEYEVRHYERAAEMWYVRIPRTPVGLAYRSVVKSNVGADVRLTEEDRTLSVQVLDVFIPEYLPCVALTATTWLKFRYDLSFMSISTGDDYDVQYDLLVEKGKIANIARREALKGYGETLLYLEGEKWETR